MRPLNVRAVRMLYRHWGKHSGFGQFLRYLDPEHFDVKTQMVPLQPEEPRKLDRLSKDIAEKLSRGCVNWYTTIDLIADFMVFLQCVLTRVDVVHYLDGEHSLGYLPRLLRTSRLVRHRPRVVVTFHQPPDWLEDIVWKENLYSVDHVTVVSSGQKDFFQKLAPNLPVSFIPHGIDTDFFHPAPSINVQKDKFICLTVGNWLRDIDLVLALAEKLRDQDDIEFHLLGCETPEIDRPNLVFHGKLSDEALRNLYRETDILLLPLQNCTANNTLLEGIACGLPVVASDLPGVRDYLPGEEAIRIKGGSLDDYKTAVLNLRDNTDRLVKMSSSARARAEEYDWKKIVRRYEAIYRNTITTDK